MKKIAILVGLGDYYQFTVNGNMRLKFVEQNVKNLMAQLVNRGWEVPYPIFDAQATKQHIIGKLDETLLQIGEDGHLCFFYSGHAAKSLNSAQSGNNEVYFVTSNIRLTENPPAPFDTFFNERDYRDFVGRFNAVANKGHLITILDCCFAYGIVDGISTDARYHSVLSASSANASAQFRENSFFFSAFSQSWQTDLDHMDAAIDLVFRKNRWRAGSYIIRPAADFKDYTI
jgi:hypothetical protein